MLLLFWPQNSAESLSLLSSRAKQRAHFNRYVGIREVDSDIPDSGNQEDVPVLAEVLEKLDDFVALEFRHISANVRTLKQLRELNQNINGVDEDKDFVPASLMKVDQVLNDQEFVRIGCVKENAHVSSVFSASLVLVEKGLWHFHLNFDALNFG